MNMPALCCQLFELSRLYLGEQSTADGGRPAHMYGAIATV